MEPTVVSDLAHRRDELVEQLLEIRATAPSLPDGCTVEIAIPQIYAATHAKEVEDLGVDHSPAASESGIPILEL